MKNAIIVLCFLIFSCKTFVVERKNLSPILNLQARLVSINPFVYEFKANAMDQEFDELKFTWDFGDGKVQPGQETERYAFKEGNSYLIKVIVSDGKSEATTATININTFSQEVLIDNTKKYQKIDGFGVFGAQNVYWSSGPFTSERFVKDIVEDLGCTIVRDEVSPSFELVNDNDDPYLTDFNKFNIYNKIKGYDEPLGTRFINARALYNAGVRKFISSVWSPPAWMKWNNSPNNGTPNNSAPNYNYNPNSNTNQLKTEYYEEFAEYLVAYCKTFKQEVGIDLYAISLQNEPRFSQFYSSCVFNGDAYRDVLKIVGNRFKKEKLNTKFFGPEDVGYFEAADKLIQPTLADIESRDYLDIVATHGYAFDGISAGSNDAQIWQKMFNWGNKYNKPLWMTETSGFKNSHDGAIDLAKAMYTALKYGNISAWVFWTVSTENLDDYNLMSSNGQKSKRYFVSKQFYKYIRPNAVRVETSSSNEVLSLGFENEGISTIILINTTNIDKVVKIKNGSNTYKIIRTTELEDSKVIGNLNSGELLIVPSKGIVTLHSDL